MEKKGKLNIINTLELFNIFMKIKNKKNIEYIKIFIKDYFLLVEDMPNDFYELLLNQMCSNNYMNLFRIFTEKNIYLLISYLKYNKEEFSELEEILTPLEYYNISKKHINIIIGLLKKLEFKVNNSYLNDLIKDDTIWLLKREPQFTEEEYRSIAYKIYLTIGFDNGVELLSLKYGEIDYEKVYFLFSRLDTKNCLKDIYRNAFVLFLFNNKKDSGNIFRQMLTGEFKELFLNFDYFYNNFSYFVSKLGIKLSKARVKLLLEERYLSKNVLIPEMTADILDDMLSSYYYKYDVLDTPKQEVYKKNFEIYNQLLRGKCKSSIPQIDLDVNEGLLCETLSLNDPRNLVLGYRAGNCFRINGDASILFNNFLKSEHMRLVSISTIEHKDYAMMLIMRNGNVLIGQGIEVSKWAPSNIKGKKLYDTCREVLRKMMEYMNSMGDEIVATIIGSSNSNVSEYNSQILPFLINPILENSSNYYNGIYNYQCLLDISEGKNLYDIKLYVPSVRYFDKREPVLRRTNKVCVKDSNYIEIEKRLRTLRFIRIKKDGNYDFYKNLLQLSELYVSCNKDWYIILFYNGTIDSFVCSEDERAIEEFNKELVSVQEISRKRLGRTLSK